MGLKRALWQCLPTSSNRLRWKAERFAGQTLAADLLKRIDETPGCLNSEQGALLCYLAAHSPGPGRVVEIGSFMGRSTLWLAGGTRHADLKRVVSIDPHDGHERPDVRADLDSFTMFLHNIREAGFEEWVEPRRERSQQAATRWQEPIGLLWIDGSHDYEDVLADLKGFVPHVVAGGHVALHDTRGRHFPGVRRAMLEYFRQRHDFRRCAQLRNMTVYQRSSTSK